MRGNLCALLIAPLALLAAADYPDYPAGRCSAYPHSVRRNGLTICVHPVESAAEQRKYFGTRLDRKGFLPLLVVMENDTPGESFLFRSDSLALRAPEAPANASQAIVVSGALVSGAASATGTVLGLGSMGTPIPLTPLGLDGISNATGIRRNLLRKQLQSQTLSPGERVSGFLYLPVSALRAGKDLRLMPDLLAEALTAVPGQPPDQPRHTRALKAAVVLTPELCAAIIAPGPRVAPADFPLRKESFAVGRPLCEQLENSLGYAFASVTRLNRQPAATAEADVILTPRFAGLNATRATGPAPAFGNRELLILLEWTARDAAGNTVWIETVQGSATGRQGSFLTRDRQRLTSSAVDDLLRASTQRMSEAVELRRLAR